MHLKEEEESKHRSISSCLWLFTCSISEASIRKEIQNAFKGIIFGSQEHQMLQSVRNAVIWIGFRRCKRDKID